MKRIPSNKQEFKQKFTLYLIKEINSGRADKEKIIQNTNENILSAKHYLEVVPADAITPKYKKYLEWRIEYNQYALEELKKIK